MNVKLQSITPEAQGQIMYCARVSNPKNQDSDNSKLLNYCIKHGHWSVFEMANMTLEFNDSRAILRQILRHRSFSFQEFSLRYADVRELSNKRVHVNPRRQDTKNRQNSIDDLPQEAVDEFNQMQIDNWNDCLKRYARALELGIAKENARAFLPEGQTPSRLYMNGTVRSWIHFLDLRTGNGTQKECQDLANKAREIFCEELPIIGEALGWK
jgi:thymidylate synthase (FAD)